jgi:hypothetical protein
MRRQYRKSLFSEWEHVAKRQPAPNFTAIIYYRKIQITLSKFFSHVNNLFTPNAKSCFANYQLHTNSTISKNAATSINPAPAQP